MIIYNTTYLIADNQYNLWMRWLKDKHIPFMFNSGFADVQIAKVLSADKEQEGTSVSVQFKIATMDELIVWSQASEDKIAKELATLFGTQVLFFSTALELLD